VPLPRMVLTMASSCAKITVYWQEVIDVRDSADSLAFYRPLLKTHPDRVGAAKIFYPDLT
jgi:hypothetical protein